MNNTEIRHFLKETDVLDQVRIQINLIDFGQAIAIFIFLHVSQFKLTLNQQILQKQDLHFPIQILPNNFVVTDFLQLSPNIFLFVVDP